MPRRPPARPPRALLPARALLPLLLALLALPACSRTDIAWTPVTAPPLAPNTAPSLPFDGAAGSALDREVVSPDTSAFIVDWFVHLPFALLIASALALMIVHRRRARRAAAFSPTAPLVDGPAILSGVVEADPSWQGPFVQVAIHQRGREWQNKGSWHHTWREERRDVNARPFVLVRDDGVRVQVDPGADVRLRDDHGRIVRHSRDTRTRYAELAPGERAYVTGELTGANAAATTAYRGAAVMPVLRRPRHRPMVVSTEQPGDLERKRMGFHRGWLIGLATCFAFIALVIMPAYELLSLTGETVWATPTAVRTWREWRKPRNSAGYWVTLYSVRAEAVDNDGTRDVFEDNTGYRYFECASTGQCPRVPFEVSSIAPSWHQIGLGPTITSWRVALMMMFIVGLLIAYPISAFASRPWYMKSRVVDTAAGRLG